MRLFFLKPQSMRILFLNNFYYLRGGSERVLFDEMRILEEAGHEVAIFSRAHDKNNPSEFSGFFPPPINTERLGFSTAAVKTAKELIYSNDARRGLRKVLNLFRPEIVHAHNIYGRLSLSVLDELKAAGIPVVMTLHDMKLLCPSYLMLKGEGICERCRGNKFHRAFLNRCHKNSYAASFIYFLESWINHASGKYASIQKFIAPSRFIRDKCIDFGWESAKFAYIPNFIDCSLIRPSREVEDYLLYIGRLSHEKGVGVLLDACRNLNGSVRIKIVGDGPDRGILERKANALRLPVEFTGYLSGVEISDVFSKARGVVMPSTCYENAPLSVLEAFSHCKPVIGSRIGGIPEMIDDGVDGYLFEAGNVADLQSKLDTFLALHADSVKEMGEAARVKVEREYNPESHYGQLMDIYRQAISFK